MHVCAHVCACVHMCVRVCVCVDARVGRGQGTVRVGERKGGLGGRVEEYMKLISRRCEMLEEPHKEISLHYIQ